MRYDFLHEFNELEIRRSKRFCKCKICDSIVQNKDIVYIKSFRLNAQPFHICLDCWEKINLLVEEYKRHV